jgi:hypothetical protein
MNWITFLVSMDPHALVYAPRRNDLPTFTSSETTCSVRLHLTSYVSFPSVDIHVRIPSQGHPSRSYVLH